MEKTIIFSQFTTMLDLIELFLDAHGVKHVRCMYALIKFSLTLLCAARSGINTDKFTPLDDGSMSKDKREASLEKIRNSRTTRCILISFKAGSTGESHDSLCLPLSFYRLCCLL